MKRDKRYTAHWIQRPYYTTARQAVVRDGVPLRKKGDQIEHDFGGVHVLASGPVWETFDEAMTACLAVNDKYPEIFQWPVEGRWMDYEGASGTVWVYVAQRDCWASGKARPEWTEGRCKTVEELRRSGDE